MPKSSASVSLLVMAVLGFNLIRLAAVAEEEQGPGSCPFSSTEQSSVHHHDEHLLHSGSECDHSHEHLDHHHHGHGHGHHHGHGHGHHHHDHHHHSVDENLPKRQVDSHPRFKLPEELAEEGDLEIYGFDFHGEAHDHNDRFHGGTELSKLGLWIHAMGCSLLVSMASLICLVILPVIFSQGKPSKLVVDSLAAFGAGAMLGDAFLHQLPHAFGGEHSHSHDHSDHDHLHHDGLGGSHSHSLQDLSVGLSILSGIVLFLIVEKLVRYVEDHSGKGAPSLGQGHHHHHHKNGIKLGEDHQDILNPESIALEKRNIVEMASENDASKDCSNETTLRKRHTSASAEEEKPSLDTANNPMIEKTKYPARSQSSLVFGYLNLFSDGVHNFTDGMALGSAFLLYGSVGGWSRTLFLLAHELPQEIGDFGILVRSGFSVFKALFFNFLSALVALAGTALALLIGKGSGNSSLIEGFTAGGFIYIAVAGVLPEMNNGSNTFKSTVIQLSCLILGMCVALCISLLE